jgi:threonine dehydrogenase-like Zn-dependent dehydrogenase
VLAIKLQADGNAKCEETQAPRAVESSLVVKIVHAPICGTDGAILKGKIKARPGVTLGHEYFGEVADVGDQISGFQIGDRVLGSPSVPCLNCYYCRRGDTQLCNRFAMFGVDIDGSFAEYMLVPSPGNALSKTTIDGKLASLLGDTVATGYRAIEQAGLDETHTLAIIGAGPIGCAALITASTKNSKDIYVIERSKYRLSIAEELGGRSLNAVECDAARQVLQDTLLGVDIVIDCAGSQSTLDLATRLTKKGGRIIVASIMPEVRLTMQELTVNEKQIIGAFCPTGPAYLRKIQDFVSSNNLQSKLAKLVTHEFDLKDGIEAIGSLDSPERMKVLITP